ncbi:MAG: hypothetical protein JWM68_2266 [Verrucomicrobiales bacterium]|nr:hypothetical protein [Verrucomicrobiales bacterium]
MKCFRVFVSVFLFIVVAAQGKQTPLTFSCADQNDLYVTARKSGLSCKRFNTAALAIENASDDSVVLVLSEKYPAELTTIDQETLAAAEKKHLHLFIEFPETNAFPEIQFGSTKTIAWERGVVADDVFGDALPRLHIVAVHDCHYLPCKAAKPWLVIARVAGFDIAPYGIPTNASPLLFEIPERRIIVATTKLSNFISARYAPSADWKRIWETILTTLDPSHGSVDLKWTPEVAPKYSAAEKLPRNFERKAFDASAKWILNSRLLVGPSRTNEIVRLLSGQTETIEQPLHNEYANGTCGILEGYAAGIRYDGTQLQRLPLRADCHAESAMVLALNATMNRDRRSSEVAANLLDYVYFKSGMCGGPRADEKHGAFGLIGWGAVSPAWLVANYGDDEARVMLGTIAAAASLKNEQWNEPLAKGLLANFRVTGKLGFAGDRIDIPALEKNGWKYFGNAETVNLAPHFESYLWACNLWAYRSTGFQPFLDKATNAIAMTMEKYPAGWRLQDNSERSRMLLCLSWLVRLEDTAQHREWLKTVATDLLKHQQPNGAIHEWLGGTGGGHYQIPQSNEAFGTGETPLIQKNGDPASDQLYTTGFALFGLHEAVSATGDATLRDAEDKLAEFLCRIQIQSEKNPYLDGWWFRAFDDRRWEYWASSADAGWGAWSIEAGWAQSWTSAVLALRDKKTSFWEFTSSVDIKEDFEQWRPRMLE